MAIADINDYTCVRREPLLPVGGLQISPDVYKKIQYYVELYPHLKADPNRITDAKISTVVGQVLDEKKKLTQQRLDNTWDRYNPIMIGGDLFTMLYLGFETVKIIVPKTAALPGVAIAGLLCGEIAGVINIGVAIISLKEAIQAFTNGDKALGWRLLLDFVFMFAIGIVMILVATAIKVAALSVLGAALAANPWLLPVLFFITSIPVIVELCQREKKILTHTDLGSELNPKQLETTTRSFDFDLPPAFTVTASSEQELKQKIIAKMEEFQAEIGVEAALEAFQVWKHMLDYDQEEAIEAIGRLKERIDEWNRAQHVRSAQEILYTLGFILCLGALAAPKSADTINAIDNIAMAAANGIPLHMDTFWPFRRNTPMVVPIVDINTLPPLAATPPLIHANAG